MTATHDRTGDPEADSVEPAWGDRPLFGTFRGLPWWAAVLVALGASVVGAIADIVLQSALGMIFQIGFVAGCAGAVALVRRRNLFGPMVQPPLVFAIVFIVASIVSAPAPAGGGSMSTKDLVFSVGLPLASNFPAMAVGTVVAVLLGILRLVIQQNPNKSNKTADKGAVRNADRKGGKETPANRGRGRESDAGEPLPRPAPPGRQRERGAPDGRQPRPERRGVPPERGVPPRGAAGRGAPPRQEPGNRRAAGRRR